MLHQHNDLTEWYKMGRRLNRYRRIDMEMAPWSKSGRFNVRLLSGLVLIMLVFALAACVSEPTPLPASPTTTVASGTPASTVTPDADTGDTDKPDDTGSEDSTAGEISAAAAERTPIPTPVPGPLGSAIEGYIETTGLAERTFLGLTTEEWIELSLSLLWIVAGYFIALPLFGRLFRWLVSNTSTQVDNTVWTAISRYAKWLVMLWIIRSSILRLGFLTDGFRTALNDFFFFGSLLVVTKMALTLISLTVSAYRTRFAQQETIDDPEREERLDPVVTALHRLADFFVLITALSIGLVHFGVNVNAMYLVLLIAVGVLSFGAKDVVTDAVSGMVILVDQPFRTGDAILIEELNTSGNVVKIGSRRTHLRTGDHREVVVRNTNIVQGNVVNYTSADSHYRVQTDLGVDYAADMEKARDSVTATVRGVEGVMADKPVDVLYQSFGDSSRAVRVRWWIDSFHDESHVLDKVNEALDVALSQADMNLPFTTYTLQVELENGEVASQPQSGTKS
jgi:small-conductance mechanosensitive channel